MYKSALLIVPPTGKYIREDRCQTPIEELYTVALRPPIDLMYLGSILEKHGVECTIRDYPALDMTWDDYKEDFKTTKPDLLALSITSPSFPEDVKAAQMAKEIKPETLTFAKGAHFFYEDKSSLEKHPYLDFVIRGEYEETIDEIAQGKEFKDIHGITFRNNDGIIKNPDRGFNGNLDSIPFPARHLIDNELYIRPDFEVAQTTIVTSRGCPYKCIFCLAPTVSGKKVRLRSPQNIVDECKECVEKYNIKDFLFRSDTFTMDQEWVAELCDLIQKQVPGIRWSCNSRVDTIEYSLFKKMKDGGCWLISFGIESGSQTMLKKMFKGIKKEKAIETLAECKKSGIKTSIYFVIGLPWETPETIEESTKFAKEINPDFLEIFYAYPFKGTKYRDIAEEENLIDPNDIPLPAYAHPSIPTLGLSVEDLEPLRRKMLRKFYMRPGYILRTLAANPNPTVWKNYFIYGLKQFKDFLSV